VLSQFGQQGSNNWDTPPWQFNEIQRRGFQDGIAGARKDLDNHRQPDVNNREEYRSPTVPEPMHAQYRQGFQLGYQRAVTQLTGTNQQQVYGQLGGNYGVPAGQLSEIQRRGYQDGMDGARKDLDNHRQPDVNNREEYRSPTVPYAQQSEYRRGFQLGYQQVASQVSGIAQPGYPQQNNSDSPSWFDEVQRRGFQDGVDGARKDLDNHRQHDVNNRDEYRHPNVSSAQQDEYRRGFQLGYQRTVSQVTGTPQTSMYGQQHGNWETSPGQFSEIQRRGFRDGMDGARKDLDNNRQPDVNNRDEYRQPNVGPSQQDEYRIGFQRGYDRAIAQLTGQSQWRTRDSEQSRWDMPSGQYNDTQRRGFQDGITGAQKDYDNHRRPDVNNRDEYRHPNVPSSQQRDYRRGFQLGYQQAMSQLMGQTQRSY